jgi:TonB family protein
MLFMTVIECPWNIIIRDRNFFLLGNIYLRGLVLGPDLINMVNKMTPISKYIFLFLLLSSFGQFTASAQKTPIDAAMRTADITPSLPGCKPALLDECTKGKLAEFIAMNLKIPDEAKSLGAGGVVMVEFVVEKNGKVGEVKTLHDPGYGLGTEAVRVIRLMNEKKMKWSPAREKGKKVPFRYVTPVAFNLLAPPRELPSMEAEKSVMPGVYEVAEIMPRYAGCDQAAPDSLDCTFMQMLKHIQTNLNYPEEALSVRAEGPVVVDFVIDAKGQVVDPVVTKGLGYGLDQEALRIVSLMPTWLPGMQDGQPVAVKMTIPILFQLPKEKD